MPPWNNHQALFQVCSACPIRERAAGFHRRGKMKCVSAKVDDFCECVCVCENVLMSQSQPLVPLFSDLYKTYSAVFLESQYPSSDKKGATFDNEATFVVVKSDQLKRAWVTLHLRDEECVCVCVCKRNIWAIFVAFPPHTFLCKPTHPKSQA